MPEAIAPSIDLTIGRGDNSPAYRWALSFAVAGSDFALTVVSPAFPIGSGPSTTQVLTVSGGGLLLDTVNNIVTWPVAAAQTAVMPLRSSYWLQRRVPGGEQRTYAQGALFVADGAVGDAAGTARVVVTGPQGPLPSNAQIVAAVVSQIGQPGGIAGQDALAAEIARAQAAELANTSAISTEAARATAAEAALAGSQAAATPKTYPVSIATRGQTAVPLPTPPSVLSSVRLVVNFCTYAAPVIAATGTTLTWLNADFPLEPSDNVLLTYV